MDWIVWRTSACIDRHINVMRVTMCQAVWWIAPVARIYLIHNHNNEDVVSAFGFFDCFSLHSVGTKVNHIYSFAIIITISQFYGNTGSECLMIHDLEVEYVRHTTTNAVPCLLLFYVRTISLNSVTSRWTISLPRIWVDDYSAIRSEPMGKWEDFKKILTGKIPMTWTNFFF